MDIKKLLNKQFLEKLHYKLSTGNARSIYLNCIPGRYKGRIELAELETILPSSSTTFMQELMTKREFSMSITIPFKESEVPTSQIQQERALLKARLEYLIAEDKTIKENLGVNTFHFGYPIIAYKKSKDSKFIYAPIFLWEVTLKKDFKSKNSYILSRSADAGVRFNDMFTILLEDDAQIKIEPIDPVHLEDGFLNKEEIEKIVSTLNKQIFNKDESIVLDSLFPTLNKDDIKTGMVINTGVFGHFRHLKTPIIKEIKRLSQELDEENIEFLEEDFMVENNVTSLEIDPSQKKILDSLADTKHNIIQGPPGTGKSQTLTAIISTILLNGGKCLVVCEKDAALNVIKENLQEIGINSKMILKITDPIYDRALFADAMSNVLDYPINLYPYDKSILHATITQNNSYKKAINAVKDKLYSKTPLGSSYRDLIGKLSLINRTYAFKKMLLINYTHLKNPDVTSVKNVLQTLELKFRKVQDTLHLLSQFEQEYVLQLNPVDYQMLLTSVTSVKNEVSTILNTLQLLVQKANNTILEKNSNLSIFDKIYGLLSKDSKALNTSIETFQTELAIITEKRNKLPFTTKTAFSQPKLIREHLLELTNQITFLEDIINLDKTLLYDYKELMKSISELDSSSKTIFHEITKDQDLKQVNDWSALFEKSIIEHFLQHDAKETFFLNGESLNQDIDNLISGEKDERDLTTKHINATWLQKIQSVQVSPEWSSTKFYLTQKRQSPKRGPRKSLQSLFRTFSQEILTVCPVILTNPITANVLFSGQEKLFDVVLFDEASQLRLEDTITCMLLGKKIVVSGDKHQMPPSDYFDNGVTFDDTDNEDEITEDPIDSQAESLLTFSYSLTNYFEDKMLECHYRSKHPDLINFSNYAFYNGRLLPMPAQSSEPPIHFIQVDGVYQQKRRVNIDEAQKIIDVLKSEQIKHDDVIGIATLNITQRDIIREMILAETEKDEAFKTKMLQLEDKGFFVKNLENIQGDERDIIILSTTFGKNELGKFSAHFGPINNKSKGYKLLNVLVTRAKKKMYIFNSIPQTAFNNVIAQRADAKELLSGSDVLYAYLAYAQAVSNNDDQSKQALLQAIKVGDTPFNNDLSSSESLLEEEVYVHLRKHVAENRLIQQYEAGGFTIDIVILDEKTEKPILAIECDGAAYQSSYDAYAWDVYRQKMLERMGFNFHRLWSTDWWIDSEKEIEKIITKIGT